MSAALGLVLLSACSPQNTDSEAGSAVAGDPLEAAVDEDYDGPDAGNFHEIAEPEIVDGTAFTVGFLTLNGAQSSLKAVEDNAREEVERLGGSFVVKDAQANPQTQVTQMEELISADVDIIIGYPVVEEALGPSIANAESQGIPFIAVGTPVDATQDPVEGTVSSVLQGYDYIVYVTVKELAERHPGGRFGIIGLALPVDALTYMTSRMEYWGEELGMEFAGRVDAQNDTPAGFTPAAQSLLTQHDELDVILTYNDQSAVSAATAVASSGRTEVSVVTPNAGSDITADALKAGQLEFVYRTPWEEMGVTAAQMAYSVITEQNLPLPQIVNVPGYLVDPQDVDRAVWIGE